MPEQCYFKQIDEKHVSAEGEEMVWSPKMDLISLANTQGEVILYRLSWQKVWTLPAPSDGVKVTSLAWRPDGKVVAVGYGTGKLVLCDVENAEILHHAEIKGQITHMSWLCQSLPVGESWTCEPYPEDNSDLYLPKLQPLNKSYGTLNKGHSEEPAEDSKHLKSQKVLNILVIGSDGEQVHLYAYGVFPLAYVDLSLQTGTKPYKVLSAVVSQDLQMLSLFTEVEAENGDSKDYILLSYDMSLLASRHKEVRLLALKYGQVFSLITYMQATIQQMSEAWEDILMEMDSKLLKFAEEKQSLGTGTVSNDFLELLLFGTPSPELQAFLLHGLTEKGLKKLGHSIEASYSNIQKLVVKHLQNVSQSLLYHLSDLRGMSLWYDKFGVLGLNTQLLQEAVTSAGTFVLKTSELQQVIDGSIKNFKAFFRWLYVVIMRLSGEQPPPELSKMTQYDMNFVAEFLKDSFAHFSEDTDPENESIEDIFNEKEPEDMKPRFKLEKVGQYLKDEHLLYPPDNAGNPWIQFINNSANLKDSDLLYPVEAEKSLLQLQYRLQDRITTALNHPASVVGKSLQCVNKCPLFSVSQSNEDMKLFAPKINQFTVNERRKLYTIFTTDVKPSETFYILRHSTDPKREDPITEVMCLCVGQLTRPQTDPETSLEQRTSCNKHRIVDLSFYDEKTMSLLLVEDRDEGSPVLAQFSLAGLPDDLFTRVQSGTSVMSTHAIQTIDLGPRIDPVNWKILENMKAHSFAVSGSRKVACVLFSSRRRVRLFLLDVDEEDDEEEVDESQLESETSRQGDGQQDNTTDTSREGIQAQGESVDEDKENTSNMDSPTSPIIADSSTS